jgi:hypothetical protein
MCRLKDTTANNRRAWGPHLLERIYTDLAALRNVGVEDFREEVALGGDLGEV